MASTLTIRHVPDEVRNTLAARAAKKGQSLQEFMLHEVTRLAARPSAADLLVDLRKRKARSPVRVDRDAILTDRDADRR